MIDLLIAIILAPFALVAAVFTVCLVIGTIGMIFRLIFDKNKKL